MKTYNKVRYAVAATPFELKCLYDNWKRETLWIWAEKDDSKLVKVNTNEENSVVFSLSWANINNGFVLFYSINSVNVNYDMVKNWIIENILISDGIIVPIEKFKDIIKDIEERKKKPQGLVSEELLKETKELNIDSFKTELFTINLNHISDVKKLKQWVGGLSDLPNDSYVSVDYSCCEHDGENNLSVHNRISRTEDELISEIHKVRLINKKEEDSELLKLAYLAKKYGKQLV